MTCATLVDEEGRPRGYRLNQAYARAIASAGGTPILLPLVEDQSVLRSLFDSVDGLLIPGGSDMQPSTYGHEPHPTLGYVDPPLDEVDLTLARWALAEEKPVLGICRGLQCLNVAAGGTLYQDIASEIPGALAHRVDPRDTLAHPIHVDPDSRLADLFGATDLSVNTLHHQAVRDVAPGFVAVARAPDSVIEGLERPDHPFAVSVQFHPEELVPGHEASERLLRCFIEAVRR
jgi:putative glutamine amidotransferase